jgi:hypothetical protein
MTVEALRRRRPQTLAELLDAHGREIQAVPDPPTASPAP